MEGIPETSLLVGGKKAEAGQFSSRGGQAFPKKNNLPRRVRISFQDFRQKMFELRSKNTVYMLSKNFFKTILVFLPLMLLVIIIFLISTIIFIYKTNPDYGFVLSQKLRSHAYALQEKEYNQKFNQNKNFGEFCYRFFGNELNTKKIRLSLDEQMIRGSVYAYGNLYSGKINPSTLDMEINDQPATWHWRWYNWLGIGLDKVSRQTLEEMVDAPLPARKK